MWQLVASTLHYRYPSRLDGHWASELTEKPRITSHDKRTRTVDYCASIAAHALGVRVTLKPKWLPLRRECADASYGLCSPKAADREQRMEHDSVPRNIASEAMMS